MNCKQTYIYFSTFLQNKYPIQTKLSSNIHSSVPHHQNLQKISTPHIQIKQSKKQSQKITINIYYKKLQNKILNLQLKKRTVSPTEMIKIQPIHSTNVPKLHLNTITPSRYILNYTIQFEYVLGKGNFSNVYRCWNNNQPHNYMAVKLISVGALRQQKIQHLVKAEIQILRASRHENVIRCKDVYWNQSWCYIFTDYFQGGNLQNHLNKSPQKQSQTTLNLIKNIFQGLLYLQKQRIIHRDIKPANIFLKNKKAIVADLGFAKYYHQGFYDLHIGSPPYMAPQSLTKAYYCAKSDVWAFGVLLFEIFHGQGPFVNSFDMKQLIRNVCTPLNLMSLRLDLSIQMKQLILSCLEIDIQKRPKFSQIQDSWYFKKLFRQQNPTIPQSPITLRTPTRKMRQKQNIPIKQIACSALIDKKTQIKSPSFNRLNQLKSQIKRRKDNNPTFSSFILLDNVGTPQKFTLFKDEIARIQRQDQELSYFRSSRTVKTEQNQEEIDAKSIDFPELLFESQKIQISNTKPIKFNNILRSKSSRNFTQKLGIKQVQIDEQKEQGRSRGWMKKSQNELQYSKIMPRSNGYINQTIYSYRTNNNI